MFTWMTSKSRSDPFPLFTAVKVSKEINLCFSYLIYICFFYKLLSQNWTDRQTNIDKIKRPQQEQLQQQQQLY